MCYKPLSDTRKHTLVPSSNTNVLLLTINGRLKPGRPLTRGRWAVESVKLCSLFFFLFFFFIPRDNASFFNIRL